MAKNKERIIAMIPARIGSTRLKMKNLALLDGKPLIYYAINAAKESNIFDNIIINSDSDIFSTIADRYDVNYYHRPNELGSSETKSDQVVADFVDKNPCDIVVWVNPIAPLQTGKEISDIINYFLNNNLDTLHTVKDEQVHCNFNNTPINYNIDEIFAKTQDLTPVQPFVYTIMMWRTKTFLEKMKNEGHAIFCGKTGFYNVNKISSIIIKNSKDLLMAESLIQLRTKKNNENEFEIAYDEVIDKIR